MSGVNTGLSAARQAMARGDRMSALAFLRAAATQPAADFAAADGIAQFYLELDLLDDAAEASGRAVALDPDQAGAWRRLAAIELRRRRPAEACAAFANVVRLNPERAEGHSNLAGLLATLGRYDEALAHAERAIQLNPRFTNPYIHAALIAGDRGRCDEAIAWISRIPTADAKSAAVLTVKAEILVRFERYPEAFEAAREAVAKDPDNPDAQTCFGLLMSVLERDEEALKAFDRAIARAPRNPEPVVRKALIAMQLGRRSEGETLLERAQKLDPMSPSVRYMRATALDFALDPDEVAATEGLLSEVSAVGDRMQLHFALAGAHLRNGQTAKVFPHLHEGNRLKRSLIEYDVGADERLMDEIAQAFPAGRIEARGDSELGSDMIFVVGMPRSGTTLVEQILASHPLVHGAGELPDLDFVVRRNAQEFDAAFPGHVDRLSPDALAAIGRDYLARRRALPNGKRRCVDKLLSNFLYAGLIRLALPGARIIHCRRHPLDTCFSCYSKLFTASQSYTYDLAELGRYYRAYERLMAHWRAILPPDKFLEIDYERLVDDFEKQARALVAFSGLDWSDDCLRFHQSKRPVRTASMSQVRQPLYKSSIGRWRPFEAELAPLREILARVD